MIGRVERRYAELRAELEADGVRIVDKSRVWHQRVIHHLLRAVTLGGQSRYLDDYVTTLGNTIYVTPDWERRSAADRWATLRHERVHVRQFRRWGIFCMTISYLVLPLPMGLAWCRMRLERAAYAETVRALPMGLAWCRMRLERAAYAETVRAHFELGGRAAIDRLRDHVIRQFTSGSYGWMWPFPRAVARWYDALVEALERD
jgi:hypothetical protein